LYDRIAITAFGSMGFSRRKIYPRLGGAIFWGGFFAIPIADTVVLSCVPKVFMQTAEIPDVSLPIGRGAMQHFGSSCSFFFTDLLCVATVHVLPSYFKILYGFLEIGLCVQVSGVKHWSAEILWNSLM